MTVGRVDNIPMGFSYRMYWLFIFIALSALFYLNITFMDMFTLDCYIFGDLHLDSPVNFTIKD